jgi:hypothetical protein
MRQRLSSQEKTKALPGREPQGVCRLPQLTCRSPDSCPKAARRAQDRRLRRERTQLRRETAASLHLVSIDPSCVEISEVNIQAAREPELACACSLPCLVPAALGFFGRNDAWSLRRWHRVRARARCAVGDRERRARGPISGSMGRWPHRSRKIATASGTHKATPVHVRPWNVLSRLWGKA